MSTHTLQIFSGSSHLSLVREVTKILGVPMGKSITKVFDDTEIHVSIQEVVRDQDIFFYPNLLCSSE